MSSPLAVFVSRRAQAAVLAILCLAVGRLALSGADARPPAGPDPVAGTRGVLRR